MSAKATLPESPPENRDLGKEETTGVGRMIFGPMPAGARYQGAAERGCSRAGSLVNATCAAATGIRLRLLREISR